MASFKCPRSGPEWPRVAEEGGLNGGIWGLRARRRLYYTRHVPTSPVTVLYCTKQTGQLSSNVPSSMSPVAANCSPASCTVCCLRGCRPTVGVGLLSSGVAPVSLRLVASHQRSSSRFLSSPSGGPRRWTPTENCCNCSNACL